MNVYDKLHQLRGLKTARKLIKKLKVKGKEFHTARSLELQIISTKIKELQAAFINKLTQLGMYRIIEVKDKSKVFTSGERCKQKAQKRLQVRKQKILKVNNV